MTTVTPASIQALTEADAALRETHAAHSSAVTTYLDLARQHGLTSSLETQQALLYGPQKTTLALKEIPTGEALRLAVGAALVRRESARRAQQEYDDQRAAWKARDDEARARALADLNAPHLRAAALREAKIAAAEAALGAVGA